VRSLHRHFDVGLAGDHHHRRGDARGLQIGEQRQAVSAGHDDVGKDQVKALRFYQVERAGGVVADGSLMPGQAKGSRERGQRIGVVIDD